MSFCLWKVTGLNHATPKCVCVFWGAGDCISNSASVLLLFMVLVEMEIQVFFKNLFILISFKYTGH